MWVPRQIFGSTVPGIVSAILLPVVSSIVASTFGRTQQHGAALAALSSVQVRVTFTVALARSAIPTSAIAPFSLPESVEFAAAQAFAELIGPPVGTRLWGPLSFQPPAARCSLLAGYFSLCHAAPCVLLVACSIAVKLRTTHALHHGYLFAPRLPVRANGGPHRWAGMLGGTIVGAPFLLVAASAGLSTIIAMLTPVAASPAADVVHSLLEGDNGMDTHARITDTLECDNG